MKIGSVEVKRLNAPLTNKPFKKPTQEFNCHVTASYQDSLHMLSMFNTVNT